MFGCFCSVFCSLLAVVPVSSDCELVRRGKECTGSVMSAVQKRTAAGGGKIVFESGIYCFDSSAAVRMGREMSLKGQT